MIRSRSVAYAQVGSFSFLTFINGYPIMFFDNRKPAVTLRSQGNKLAAQAARGETLPRRFLMDASPSEQDVALARAKSYTTQAIWVLVGYIFLYPLGLIMNVIYMIEARKIRKIAGQSLPGQGLLEVMFWINVAGWAGLFLLGIFILLGLVGALLV
ncbi:MAG: hypothetical protein BMS9Abin34_524 [Patescibacteria group bacterium]|nr:MAG: hypothetical protein BMS9Abin34_524 [Patescibacteria group bacterium]